MKAALYTLGCKVNQYESQIMEQKLSEAGYEIAAPGEKADVFIVNSCTVTGESDRKTRQLLRRIKKENPGALTVLTGCFPQSNPEAARSLAFADVVTGTRERSRIGEIVAEALRTGGRLTFVSPFEPGEAFEGMAAARFSGHTRAFVKIEDGCSRYCSYCIIPFSRGPVRSKPAGDLLNEVRGLAAAGFREIVLVGINLSAYGSDLGLTLADAVETACGVEGVARVRLGSLEPNLITPEFIARIRKQDKLCPHFHLSLQSGSDETLKRMNRHYTAAQFTKAVELLRSAFPCCAVTTDIIAGFPGETEAEFEASLAFAVKTGFAKVHVFPYSVRQGTRAAEMPGKIPKAEKECRCRRLTEACGRERERFLQSHVGRTLPVLFETRREDGAFEGFASDYTPVRVRSPKDLHGRLLGVSVVSAGPDCCEGVLTETFPRAPAEPDHGT